MLNRVLDPTGCLFGLISINYLPVSSAVTVLARGLPGCDSRSRWKVEMRLLNTATFILEEFTGSDIPKYAILSHRWGNQEVTFQDIQHFKNFRDYFKTRKSTKSEGWSKIKGSCEQAVLDGLQWIWVDSCCIDKLSSAELSEAINSMFNWYREARVCYAYLSDVFKSFAEDNNRTSYEFRNSRWFRRGWTLQELLAPQKLVFFNRYWVHLGKRKDLWSFVSEATGIEDAAGWEMSSVAQKLSWAAKRETTRIEDRAYSLMGLFGVNMPPLYGEGENAFVRLQLEILRTSDDESIFAWRDAKNISGGLLARSPDAFRWSGDVKRFDSVHYDKPPYSMTNKGLRMEFPLLSASHAQVSVLDSDDTYLAAIQCRFGSRYTMLAILLRCVKGNQFRRISSGELIELPCCDLHPLVRIEQDPNIRRVVQVKQVDDSELSFRGLYQYKFSVASNVLSLRGFDVTNRFVSKSNRDRIGWFQGHDEMYKDEEKIWIDRVLGDEVVTAALEFTERVDNDSGRRPADMETNRFIAIFNIFATRARLGILVPGKNEKMHSLLELWSEPGDWMTDARDIFSTKTLASGLRIIPKLNRNQNELGLRSYEADISFEEPVELHDTQVLPYRILPHIPELPNNEIEMIVRNPMSGDPLINYYVSSFLIHKELQNEKQLHERDNQEDSDHEEEEQKGKEDKREKKQAEKPPADHRQSVDEILIPSYMQNLIFD